MNDILEQLKVKEQKLAELRSKEERRKGQLDQLVQQLQQEFALDTAEQASKKITEMDFQIQGLDSELKVIDVEMAGIIAAAVGGSK